MLIARYADRWYSGIAPAHVEQAMQHVLRTVFGNSFDEGYSVPAKFHTTELGKLFHEAYSKMYHHDDLYTVKQAYEAVGVARQSVYDRIADGKLHPIYFYRDLRLLRSEVEEWKQQRKLQTKASKKAEGS
jgi:predicted DNA-binding transcriptional regulator AlpA